MTSFPTARLAKAAFSGALALTLAAGAWAQPSRQSQPIPDRYIVVFKHDVANPRAQADDSVRKSGGRRLHSFSRALKGFSARLSRDEVERLRADPAVDYIEQDQTISLSTVQGSATWGLDRIDQADRPMDLLYQYDYTGLGVTAFIIDTGLRADHPEFAGRVLSGFNAEVHDTPGHVTGVVDPGDTSDCNGHGTHVSGTVGGTTWGVAKGVSLVPVRVLDCDGSGTNSGVIAGIDWVASHPARPAVANMSLGGGLSSALNAAVANAVAQGVTMVVAAGNSNQDACKYSPSSEPSAITVGATTSQDSRASFSNFGRCVDIFAPGVAITSSWNTDATPTYTISGTSMASPHVAGVAALALQANPAATPLAVGNFLEAHATANRLSSLGSGSPNLLLYSVAAGAPTEPPPVTIAVKSLTGKAAKVSRAWRGQAVVTVRNVNTGANVANATVNGTFAPGGSGSCVTSNKGSCTINSSVISATIPSTVFTVDSLAATAMTYDSSQNSASQVTINKR